MEMDGVAAFRLPGFAEFLSLAAFACLSSVNSFSTDFFNTSISYPLEIGGEGAIDRLETLHLPGLIVITNGWVHHVVARCLVHLVLFRTFQGFHTFIRRGVGSA